MSNEGNICPSCQVKIVALGCDICESCAKDIQLKVCAARIRDLAAENECLKNENEELTIQLNEERMRR